jgi:hypothetical protein
MEAMTPEERFTKIENLLATLTENQLRHDAAIRDLIVVSRTTLNAIGELREGQKELQESQKATDDKLHVLIETVDRIIRNQQK